MKEKNTMNHKIFAEKPKRKSGVYAWINIENKRVYVGESWDMNTRFCDHIRGMFCNNDKLSNTNLVRAYQTTDSPFWGIPLEYLPLQKKEKNSFLVNETIYMYEFLKKGYRLYNEIKDNTGFSRSFLQKNPYKNLYEELLKWCFARNIDQIFVDNKLKTASNNIDKALKYIEQSQKNHTCYNLFYCLKKDADINTMNELCNEMSKSYLRKADLATLGIPPMGKEEFIKRIDKNKFNRIAVCKFGNYLDQSAMTILATKLYDIEHNTLLVEADDIFKIKPKNKNKPGICFWAYGKSNTDNYRNFLSLDGKDKSPRYLILPYTTSDIYGKSKGINEENCNFENGTIDDFFSKMNDEYIKKDADVRKLINKYKKIKKKINSKNRIIAPQQRFIYCSILENIYYNLRFNKDRFAFGYAYDRTNADNKNGPKFVYPTESMFPEIIQKFSVGKNGNLRNKNVVFTFYSRVSETTLLSSSLISFTRSTTSSSEISPVRSASPAIACCNICMAYTAELTIRTEFPSTMNVIRSPLDTPRTSLISFGIVI